MPTNHSKERDALINGEGQNNLWKEDRARESEMRNT